MADDDTEARKSYADYSFTPEQVRAWLMHLKHKGIVTSDAGAGRLLGITAVAMNIMKKRGADRRTALACQAIIRKLPPYPKRPYQRHRRTKPPTENAEA